MVHKQAPSEVFKGEMHREWSHSQKAKYTVTHSANKKPRSKVSARTRAECSALISQLHGHDQLGTVGCAGESLCKYHCRGI